jgi:zinc protease
MRQVTWVLALVLVLAGVVGTQAQEHRERLRAAALGGTGDDTVGATELPTDPRLVRGELENGLSYIVRQHDNPPGRAAVWMHVHAGSLNETDQQRGIAHFLEHMAFNGSENFPAGAVVPFFESLGLRFGQHQNAFTSFEQTVYQLALPDNQPETLEKGLRFFSDVAFGLSLLPEEIEKERQIILEERRGRFSGLQRVQEYSLEHLAPGSLLGQRLPIGVEETIRGVTEQDFRDYYGKWYVPSNITLLVVADMDPQVVVGQIREHFARGERVERPAQQDARVRPYVQQRAMVAADPEVAEAVVGMAWIFPPRPAMTTEGLFRDELVENAAARMFNRRLFRLVSAGEVEFRGGGAGAGPLYGAAHLASAAVSGEPEKWQVMLEELVREVQRAAAHGFSEEEMEDIRKELLAGAERMVEIDASRPAQSILRALNDAVARGSAMMSPEQELELVRKLAPTITAKEVSERFKQVFDPAQPLTFTLQTRSGEAPGEAELLEVGQKAVAAELPAAAAARERATVLLAQKPSPGEFAEWSEGESGVWSGWLENGVRVHYRHMDYRKDQVLVFITLAGGVMEERDESRGLTQAGGVALSRPATSEYGSSDIRDLMTGMKVSVGGQAGMDTTVLAVNGKPGELEAGMQLAYLLLTDPLVEGPAFEQWRSRQRQQLMLAKLEPNRVFSDLIADTVYPQGERRVRPLEERDLARLTAEEATAWLQRIVREAPMEAAVVGDIERSEAEALVKMYLGSLPKRERMSDSTLDELRVLERPRGPRRVEKKIPTRTDKALVLAGFYGVDRDDIAAVRVMEVAARILTMRATERIREGEQLAYSPRVNSRPGAEFPGFGMFTAVSETDPGKMEALVGAFEGLFAEFAETGPTEEEMQVVQRQIANALDEQMREPSFWGASLAVMTYRGDSVQRLVEAPEAYRAITREQVQAVFARHFKPEGRFTVMVAPDPDAEPLGFVIDPGTSAVQPPPERPEKP